MRAEGDSRALAPPVYCRVGWTGVQSVWGGRRRGQAGVTVKVLVVPVVTRPRRSLETIR